MLLNPPRSAFALPKLHQVELTPSVPSNDANDVGTGSNAVRVACIWSADADINSATSVEQIWMQDVIVLNSR